MTARCSAIVIASVVLGSGCAHLQPSTSTSTEHIKTWRDVQVDRTEGRLQISLAHSPKTEELQVSLSRPVTCTERQVEYTKTQVVVTTKASSKALPLMIGGAIVVGTGAFFIRGADYRPDIDSRYSRDQLSSQGAIGIGIALLVAGASVGAPGFWAWLKRDVKKEAPVVVARDLEAKNRECGQAPVVGAEVELTPWSPDHTNIGPAVSDHHGVAILPLKDVPILLPPVDQLWAEVDVLLDGENVQTADFMPEAAVFAKQLARPYRLEELERFRYHFGRTPEWAELKSDFNSLNLAMEAKREEEKQQLLRREKEAEAQRQEEMLTDWRKGAEKALKVADRLSKSREWDEAYAVLAEIDEYEGEELNGKINAALSDVIEMRARQHLAVDPKELMTADSLDLAINELREDLSLLQEWDLVVLAAQVEKRMEALSARHDSAAKGSASTSFLLQALSPATQLKIGTYGSADRRRIGAIFELDVFSYFDLDEHDSELKKRVFKKTALYTQYLAELKNERTATRKSAFYIELDVPMGDYNVRSGRFEVFVGTNMGYGTAAARAPKEQGGFYFENLPSKQHPYRIMGSDMGGVKEERLGIRVPEDRALAIENCGKNCRVYLVFRPLGMKTVAFRFLSLANQMWYEVKHDLVKVRTVKIIIGNPATGDVYYSQEL